MSDKCKCHNVVQGNCPEYRAMIEKLVENPTPYVRPGEKTPAMKLDEAIKIATRPSAQGSPKHGKIVSTAYEAGAIPDLETALYVIAGLLEV